MEPFRFHLFICTQRKPEGVSCCPSKGALAVLEELNREIQARGLNSDVQLTTCGCMGLCDEGPIMIVYPAGVWYRPVQSSAAENAARDAAFSSSSADLSSSCAAGSSWTTTGKRRTSLVADAQSA